MKRRILQGILIVLGLILFGRFALPGLILGGQWVVEGDPISPLLDSEVRFLSVLAGGMGLLIFWLIPQIEHRTTPFLIIALSAFAGGLARILSMVQYGLPANQALIATGIELIAPVIAIVLQRSVAADDTATVS